MVEVWRHRLPCLGPAAVERRYTYRFLFVPGSLGAIAWLAREGEAAAAVHHGLVAANLGDPGRFHCKRSRRGDAATDRVVAKVLADSGDDSFCVLANSTLV